MLLAIDIGNSDVTIGMFEKNQIVNILTFVNETVGAFYQNIAYRFIKFSLIYKVIKN